MSDKKHLRKWEQQVRYALNHRETIKSMRERKEKLEKKRNLRKLVPIPILVGVLAALLMYYMYGGDVLFKAFLSWIIGLTLIATIIAYLPKNLSK
jgi:pheromone shutdown protein TraB